MNTSPELPELPPAPPTAPVDYHQRLRLESAQAGKEALAAARRIAKTILGTDNGQSLKLRDMLLSLYGGHPANLSDVGFLDWDLRKDICSVILGLGQGNFHDFTIRHVFIEAGDHEAAWFLAGLRTKKRKHKGAGLVW